VLPVRSLVGIIAATDHRQQGDTVLVVKATDMNVRVVSVAGEERAMSIAMLEGAGALAKSLLAARTSFDFNVCRCCCGALILMEGGRWAIAPT
jgi:hypothetical protein